MITPAPTTAVALCLAVLDAVCFGLAAVFQHRAVRRTVGRPTLDLRPAAEQRRHGQDHGLGLRRTVGLLRRRSWLLGTGLVLLGGGLHIVALALAPVSMIQPVGVLGVPIAVLVSAGLARYRPAAAIAVPIAGCLGSIAVFVWLAAGQRSGVPSTLTGLLVTEAVITAVVLACGLVSRRLHGWARCISSAVAGAVGLGLTSALIKGLTEQVSHGWTRLFTPVGIAMLAGVAVSGLVGGWLVQRAYASGPPEVVIACLTVVDPMVAVLIGFTVLGEGDALGVGVRAGMAACGLVAAVSVVLLARYHPEATGRHAGTRPAATAPEPYRSAQDDPPPGTGSGHLDRTDDLTRPDELRDRDDEPVAAGSRQPAASRIILGAGKEQL